MLRRAVAACLLLATSLSAQLPAALAARAAAGCRLSPSIGVDGNFTGARWTGGNVPFAYAANVTPAMQVAMAAAMQELTNVVNVRFVPRTNEVDYVLIRDSVINSSLVGRFGGVQVLQVFNWNQRFAMVHELMHVLGYWHEHQRPDRDQFVAVQAANVDPTRTTDFEIVPTGSALGRAYDFDSVLHFAGTEGGLNGATALQVLPPNAHLQGSIGQRTHLSTGDVDALRLVYGSATPPQLTSAAPSVVTTWQPGTVLLTGSLLDETTRAWLDGTQVVAFTVLSSSQVRIVVPSLMPIGAHTLQVESAIGRSGTVPLQITGNDPPVLDIPIVMVRGFASTCRVHTDQARTNLLLAAFDNQPSVIPGVISLGLGSQFTTLGPITSGVGGASGVLVTSVTVPTSIPSGAHLWFQSIVFDPAALTAPITTSNVVDVRIF